MGISLGRLHTHLDSCIAQQCYDAENMDELAGIIYPALESWVKFLAARKRNEQLRNGEPTLYQKAQERNSNSNDAANQPVEPKIDT